MAGKSMTWCRSRALLAPAALVLASVSGVQAAIITLSFQGSLTSGSLAGTKFDGSFSYDSSGTTGGSEDFLPLLSFDFDLLGVPFSRSNIGQGGQVIFHDGLLFNVTAAFLANEPPGSPVSSIAFGFGGPGTIGYLDLQRNFGAGDFTIVSEPSAVGSCLFAGLGVLLAGSLRRLFREHDANAGLAEALARLSSRHHHALRKWLLAVKRANFAGLPHRGTVA